MKLPELIIVMNLSSLKYESATVEEAAELERRTGIKIKLIEVGEAAENYQIRLLEMWAAKAGTYGLVHADPGVQMQYGNAIWKIRYPIHSR